MALYGNMILLKERFVTYPLAVQENLLHMLHFNHWLSRAENPNIPEDYQVWIDTHIMTGQPFLPGSVGWLCVGDDPDEDDFDWEGTVP